MSWRAILDFTRPVRNKIFNGIKPFFTKGGFLFFPLKPRRKAAGFLQGEYLARKILILLIIFAWLFSGWPPIFNFSPKVQEVYAAACTTAALATGTDPGADTIAPGSGIADSGQFTITGSGNTCAATVSALTVTLAGSGTPYVGLAEVSITSSDGSTTYYSAITSFASNNVSFSGGTAIPISKASVGAVTFKIRVTPKTHALMDAVPGASYDIAPYVSSWTTTLTKSGSDTNPNTTTIDNLSPTSATVPLASTVGVQNTTLKWTASSASDFQTTSGSIILRWAAATQGAEVPAEGSTYSAGNTIATATVACVISSAASAAVSKIDGTGGDAGCTTTALTGGQDYSYKVFSLDLRGNYDAGTTLNGSPFTPIDVPSVSTQAAGSVEATTATGNGTITSTNGQNATAWGVCYKTSSPCTIADSVAAGSGTGGVGAFTASMISLSTGTTYYIKAYATNSAGTSYGSEVTILTKPAAPTALNFTSVTATTLRLNWTALTGAASYKVERCAGAGCSSFSEIASGVTTAYYDDSILTCNTLYRYRVRATNATGDGSYSSIAEQTTGICGSITADIVNGSYVSVSSPTMAMNSVTFSLICQTATGSFGTASQQIYVNNNNGADNGWTLTLAAQATTNVWDSAGIDYDFNDPTGSGCTDGGDADGVGGQMTVDPSVATLAIGQCGSCTTNNISKGSSAAFNQGTTDTITLLTATATSDDVGDWTLQGVSISQTIPAEQPAASDYNINMTLTVTAN